jgi:hypothetical protein
MNFSCVVAPTCRCRCSKSRITKPNPHRHHDSNHWYQSSDLGFHDILCDWLHHVSKDMSHDGNRPSRRSLWNQTVRKKHGCARPNSIWSINLQAWRPLEFADETFRNSTLRPDQWRHTSSRSSSWHKRDPRTASLFFDADKQAPTPPSAAQRRRRRFRKPPHRSRKRPAWQRHMSNVVPMSQHS